MKVEIKLDTSKEKKQGYPVVISIYNNKNDRKYPYTGYYSSKEDWDFDRQEPLRSHPLYYGLMDYLFEKRKLINALLNSRKKLSSDNIQNYLLGKSESLFSFWAMRIEEMKESGSVGNAEFHENTLRLFQQFKKDILFEELNYNLLTQFKNFKSKTCGNNTINNYLRAIRSIYNESVKRGVFMPESHISPFYGVMPKLEPTRDKYLSIEEMQIIYKSEKKHRFYKLFMLCFYLGGIDFIDAANIKKSHIQNGRIKFTRFKGGTNEQINNFIFPEAQEILDDFADESEYLTPIHKFSYKTYRKSYLEDYRKWLQKIGVTSYFSTKTPRYTFINIGKQLLLNRDVVMELTGHARGDVHSIYEGGFPDHVKDDVHLTIIQSIKKDHSD